MFDILRFLLELDTLIVIGLFFAIMIFQVVLLFFPKDAVLLYMGILFGFLDGGVINLLGLFAASWFGYELGTTEFICNNRVTTRKSFMKVRSWFDDKGAKALILIRAVPVIPYNIISLGAGVTKINRSKYLTITFFFAIPYAFLWAYIGSHSYALLVENI